MHGYWSRTSCNITETTTTTGECQTPSKSSPSEHLTIAITSCLRSLNCAVGRSPPTLVRGRTALGGNRRYCTWMSVAQCTIERMIFWMSRYQIITLSELYSTSCINTNVPTFQTQRECVRTSGWPRCCSMVVSKGGNPLDSVDQEMVVRWKAVGHRMPASMVRGVEPWGVAHDTT